MSMLYLIPKASFFRPDDGALFTQRMLAGLSMTGGAESRAGLIPQSSSGGISVTDSLAGLMSESSACAPLVGVPPRLGRWVAGAAVLSRATGPKVLPRHGCDHRRCGPGAEAPPIASGDDAYAGCCSVAGCAVLDLARAMVARVNGPACRGENGLAWPEDVLRTTGPWYTLLGDPVDVRSCLALRGAGEGGGAHLHSATAGKGGGADTAGAPALLW